MKFVVGGYIGTRADSAFHFIKVEAKNWDEVIARLKARWPYFHVVFGFTLEDWNRRMYAEVRFMEM